MPPLWNRLTWHTAFTRDIYQHCSSSSPLRAWVPVASPLIDILSSAWGKALLNPCFMLSTVGRTVPAPVASHKLVCFCQRDGGVLIQCSIEGQLLTQGPAHETVQTSLHLPILDIGYTVGEKPWKLAKASKCVAFSCPPCDPVLRLL